jgi:hypothetical protein
MEKTLAALGLAAAVGLLCCQSAGAAPATAANVKEAATTVSPLQTVQYVERRKRHGVVKCYREFVVGPYRCHYFPSPF